MTSKTFKLKNGYLTMVTLDDGHTLVCKASSRSASRYKTLKLAEKALKTKPRGESSW